MEHFFGIFWSLWIRACSPAVSRNYGYKSSLIQRLAPCKRFSYTRDVLPKVRSAVSHWLPALRSFKTRCSERAASGYRANDSGALTNVTGNGNYWSFAPNSQTNARNLNFNSGNVNPLNNNERSNGFAVRPCRALNTRPEYAF